MNNLTGPSVSYSVHEVKKIASAVQTSFLNLIYHGPRMVVHLLLLKLSMIKTHSVNHTLRFAIFLLISAFSEPRVLQRK